VHQACGCPHASRLSGSDSVVTESLALLAQRSSVSSSITLVLYPYTSLSAAWLRWPASTCGHPRDLLLLLLLLLLLHHIILSLLYIISFLLYILFKWSFSSNHLSNFEAEAMSACTVCCTPLLLMLLLSSAAESSVVQTSAANSKIPMMTADAWSSSSSNAELGVSAISLQQQEHGHQKQWQQQQQQQRQQAPNVPLVRRSLVAEATAEASTADAQVTGIPVYGSW